MKKTINALCLLTILCLTAPATMAGHDQGGGGDTVLLNGQLYLLDLVEAGVQDSPYINTSIKMNEDIYQKVKEYLVNVPNAPSELVARKLTELYLKDQLAAYAVLGGIRNYSWRVVVPELIELLDDQDTVLKIKTYKQLAVRKGMTITISSALWNSIDNLNKAALIYHEIFYAMINHSVNYTVPKYGIENSDNLSTTRSEASARARAITGFMFTPEFENEGLDLFRSEIGLYEKSFGIAKFLPSGKEIHLVSANPKEIHFAYTKNGTGYYSHIALSADSVNFGEALKSICQQAKEIMAFAVAQELMFGLEPYQRDTRSYDSHTESLAPALAHLNTHTISVASISEVGYKLVKDRRGKERKEPFTQVMPDLKKCIVDINSAVSKIQKDPLK